MGKPGLGMNQSHFSHGGGHRELSGVWARDHVIGPVKIKDELFLPPLTMSAGYLVA